MSRAFRYPRGTFDPDYCGDSGYTVYIAGPISGDLVGNLPVFFEAEEVLLNAGHTVFNPARIDGGNTAAECVDRALAANHSWTWYMQRGISGLTRCNAIATLPHWYLSRGADLEQRIAAALGYAVIDHATGDLLRDTVIKNGSWPEEFAS